MAFFADFPSVPLIYCSFRSKFRRFCQVTRALCPVLHVLRFQDTTRHSLQLVAHFVGGTNQLTNAGGLPALIFSNPRLRASP
jgi:hypothetical protein